MSNQRYIFISYSRRDSDLAHTLADNLRDRQLALWLDTDSIRDGDNWLETIQQGVEECAALVVVMSRAARESEWVQRETLLALELRKPVFIARIEDVPLPLHLITRQYTDFTADYETGVDDLAVALQRVLQRPVPHTEKQPLPQHLSPHPNEENFFVYLEQMGEGDDIALLARDLFHWAQTNADSVTFGGMQTPCFHARVRLPDDKDVTVLSVLAYLRNPSVQIPFDYLRKYPPFTDARLREAALDDLNALLPPDEQFAQERASRRPTVPLTLFTTANRLEAFKSLVDDLMLELRATVTQPS